VAIDQEMAEAKVKALVDWILRGNQREDFGKTACKGPTQEGAGTLDGLASGVPAGWLVYGP
jgi:hypothetical protein